MIICDDRQFAFIHIPKCAGTSVRRALHRLDTRGEQFFRIGDHGSMGRVHMAHLTLPDLATFYPATLAAVRGYRSMAIVRDPVDRFYSAITQRLREFGEIAQSAITPAMVEQDAHRVIDYLESGPPRIDLEHVHFQRQCDFVELGGERIVKAIFPLRDMAAAARYIHALTGVEVGEEKRNSSVELRFGVLRPVQRVLRDHYARWVPATRRAEIRRRMTRAGLYRDITKQRYIQPGDRVDRFIRDYYARDFEIIAALDGSARIEAA